MTNAKVVTTINLIAAGLGCNTAFESLGAGLGARAVLHYIIKYVTKNEAEVELTAGMVCEAYKHNIRYPSLREQVNEGVVINEDGTNSDPLADTNTRTPCYLLQRLVNDITAKTEINQVQAAYILLGGLSHTCDRELRYFNVRAAIKVLVENYDDDTTPLFANVFHDDGKDSTSDNDDEDSETEQKHEPSDDSSDTYEHLDQGKLSENHCAPRDIEELNANSDDELFEEREPARQDFFSSLNYKQGSGCVRTVKLKDEVKSIPFILDYGYRGDKLKELTLFMYNAIIAIRAKKQNGLSNEEEADEIPHNEAEEDENPTCIRTTNKAYDFGECHPLYHTHEQVIRSKFMIPFASGGAPPKPPTKNMKGITLQRACGNYSAYKMLQFVPWTLENFLWDNFTWKAFQI
eukprot:GHVU01125654.1.p1 GENE.GHVU01125654.1~~GHVU01125654.1.p1  ORF type:complete len:405 (+),score=35.71 GHVU01125654.1:222-1436(+)